MATRAPMEAPAAAPPATAFQVQRGPDRAGRVRKEQDRLFQRIAAHCLGKVRDPSGALGLRAIFPDHLEVTVSGVPRLNVALDEVGLPGGWQFCGVGGPGRPLRTPLIIGGELALAS